MDVRIKLTVVFFVFVTGRKPIQDATALLQGKVSIQDEIWPMSQVLEEGLLNSRLAHCDRLISLVRTGPVFLSFSLSVFGIGIEDHVQRVNYAPFYHSFFLLICILIYDTTWMWGNLGWRQARENVRKLRWDLVCTWLLVKNKPRNFILLCYSP